MTSDICWHWPAPYCLLEISRERYFKGKSPSTESGHTYVSEVQSRQGAISHLRLLHDPKWLRVLALPIGVAFSSYVGPEKISSELDDQNLARASVGPCHTASSGKVPVVELWRDFFWTQVRREGVPCEPSSDDPVTGHIGKFCHRGCGSGAEELPLLRHAISGALADTNEWTRTNLLWTNTFSYV